MYNILSCWPVCFVVEDHKFYIIIFNLLLAILELLYNRLREIRIPPKKKILQKKNVCSKLLFENSFARKKTTKQPTYRKVTFHHLIGKHRYIYIYMYW